MKDREKAITRREFLKLGALGTVVLGAWVLEKKLKTY
jgi:hypothetical protein